MEAAKKPCHYIWYLLTCCNASWTGMKAGVSLLLPQWWNTPRLGPFQNVQYRNQERFANLFLIVQNSASFLVLLLVLYFVPFIFLLWVSFFLISFFSCCLATPSYDGTTLEALKKWNQSKTKRKKELFSIILRVASRPNKRKKTNNLAAAPEFWGQKHTRFLKKISAKGNI